MFETIKKKFQTGVLVLLVTLLSLVFVLQFGGPQAEGCTAGGANFAAKVHGKVITEGDFDAAYALGSFQREPLERQKSNQLKEHVLNGLIERSLLARKARELGFRVSEDDVMKRLAEDNTVLLSLGVDAPVTLTQQIFFSRGADMRAPLAQAALPVGLKDRDGQFDKERAKRFIQYHLRRSISEFAEAQVEETLAYRLRETLRATASISPEELWNEYVQQNNQARIEYARFSPRYFRKRVEPTEEAIRQWMEDNTEALDREYEAKRQRYTDLDRQARTRHISIDIAPDATDEDKAALRRRAERIVQQARGGADFAELAKEHSDDTDSARRGGDLGWNPEGRIPDPHDEVVFELEEGGVSDVVEASGSFHIFKVEGFREGDVPEAEAKREIAESLYREHRASELARQAARAALAKMREGLGGEELDQWLREQRSTGSAPAQDQDADDAIDEDADDPLAPTVEDSGEFGPGSQPITGLDAGPLVEKVFGELSEEDPLPDEPVELGGDFVAFELLERQHADRESFTEQEQRQVMQQLLPEKEREVIRLYVHRLRRAAQEDGSIRINDAILRYGRDSDEEPGRAPAPPPSGPF